VPLYPKIIVTRGGSCFPSASVHEILPFSVKSVNSAQSRKDSGTFARPNRFFMLVEQQVRHVVATCLQSNLLLSTTTEGDGTHLRAIELDRLPNKLERLQGKMHSKQSR